MEKLENKTFSGCKNASYCSTDHQKKHWKEHKNTCKPFKMSQSPEIGRYLEATRNMESDSFILTELPLVVGPKWVQDEMEMPVTTCVGCFSNIPVISAARCKSCHWPACKPDCSGLEAEKLHKIECGVLAFGRQPNSRDPDVFLDFYRSDALLALKCLMLQAQKPKKWEKLLDLESHEKKRKGTQIYQ